MRQTFEFTNEELDEVAENATALMAWLEEDAPTLEVTERRIRIPSHLALVTTTIMASGLPLLLGPVLPGVACWGGSGGCCGCG